LRCHPLADFEYIEALRSEFEESRLLGENFSAYSRELQRDLAATLQVSDQRSFWGGEAGVEMERLYRDYVATPPGFVKDAAAAAGGTRRALRQQMESVFERHHLFGGGRRLRRDVKVPYGAGRLQFTFDYSYPPNGASRYLHGVALRNDLQEASKLCFVLERLRAREEQGVTLAAVVEDGVPPDTLELLASSNIQAWKSSGLEDLALAIRGDLGL
jgi:hypothetical protein